MGFYFGHRDHEISAEYRARKLEVLHACIARPKARAYQFVTVYLSGEFSGANESLSAWLECRARNCAGQSPPAMSPTNHPDRHHQMLTNFRWGFWTRNRKS